VSPKENALAAFRICYSGRVQGVGFRATTAGLAQRFSVTGWVRNLPDGRVELWVEGEDNEVKRFLETIRNYWKNYIRDEEMEPQAVSGQFEDFGIRR
jgi:acylphosphatase